MFIMGPFKGRNTTTCNAGGRLENCNENYNSQDGHRWAPMGGYPCRGVVVCPAAALATSSQGRHRRLIPEVLIEAFGITYPVPRRGLVGRVGSLGPASIASDPQARQTHVVTRSVCSRDPY